MAISLSKQDRLTLISEMGTMISSGIPISEAIDSLLKEAKGNQKKILESLKKDLNEGKSIAESFAKYPDAFDPIITNLIKSAEESGKLDIVMKDIVVSLKKEIEFDDKVKSAMAYPAMIVLVFLGVMTMILTFVMPRISSVFSKLRVNMPLPTQILIGTSNIIMNYAPLVILGIVIFIFSLVLLYKFQKKNLMNIFLSLPIISGLAREVDFARLTHSLSLLLQSGLPITESLDLVSEVVSKKEIVKLIKHCQQEIQSGESLSTAFRDFPKLVPGTMIRITEAGEKSGKLDSAMQELSDYFDGRVANSLKTVTTLIEPIMLVVIGVVVGGMMLAIIAPIYNLIGQINAK